MKLFIRYGKKIDQLDKLLQLLQKLEKLEYELFQLGVGVVTHLPEEGNVFNILSNASVFTISGDFDHLHGHLVIKAENERRGTEVPLFEFWRDGDDITTSGYINLRQAIALLKFFIYSSPEN